MFYNFLYPYAHVISFFNLFQYISFRSGAAFLTTLSLALYFGKPLIKKMRAIQGKGQPIRSDGPESHFSKAGTPTMGGVLILGATLISALLWCDLNSHYMWMMIIAMVGYGAIGFADDYLKVAKKNPKGVSGKIRLLAGAILSFVISYWTYQISPEKLQGVLAFPISMDFQISLGIFFLILAPFVIVGTANAVNLTDGLDGLATGPVFIAAGAFAVIAYMTGNFNFSEYLQIHHIPGSGELTVFLAALMGGCLGFLWFNAPPAMIFMGDTGSLSLGAILGTAAIIVKHEIILIVIGGIFVAETVSVILQVVSFKTTGKRIFRMAPLHHHFEKKGWPETRVVLRFWIIAIILALLGLASLKVR